MNRTSQAYPWPYFQKAVETFNEVTFSSKAKKILLQYCEEQERVYHGGSELKSTYLANDFVKEILKEVRYTVPNQYSGL